MPSNSNASVPNEFGRSVCDPMHDIVERRQREHEDWLAVHGPVASPRDNKDKDADFNPDSGDDDDEEEEDEEYRKEKAR